MVRLGGSRAECSKYVGNERGAAALAERVNELSVELQGEIFVGHRNQSQRIDRLVEAREEPTSQV